MSKDKGFIDVEKMWRGGDYGLRHKDRTEVGFSADDVCDDCYHFDMIEKTVYGYCKRYPPVGGGYGEGGLDTGHFPVVMASWTCGEFRQV